MIASLAQGIGFGYAAGMTPGPLQAFLLTQTLRHGWRHSVWLVFSPLLSDGPIVALVLLVLQGASESLLRIISLIGGAFVLTIAWGLWRQLRRGAFEPEALAGEADAAESVWAALRQAVLINALGPGPWLFWGTAMGPVVIETWRGSPPGAVAFVLGFYGAFLAVMAVQVIAFHQARRLGQGVIRVALWIGLLALVIFAVRLWWG